MKLDYNYYYSEREIENLHKKNQGYGNYGDDIDDDEEKNEQNNSEEEEEGGKENAYQLQDQEHEDEIRVNTFKNEDVDNKSLLSESKRVNMEEFIFTKSVQYYNNDDNNDD
jgi:hypothetical protein